MNIYWFRALGALSVAVPALSLAQISNEVAPAKLEIGKTSSIFNLRGLESEIEILEYKNGDNPTTQKRPGRAKFSNIVMKRGWTGDNSLIDQIIASLLTPGALQRKSGSVILMDREGNEVLRYGLPGVQGAEIEFPAFGIFAPPTTSSVDVIPRGITLTLKAKELPSLPKQNIVHRDLAMRNLLVNMRSFKVEVIGDGSVRTLDCLGGRSFQVRPILSDIEGETDAKVVKDVASDDLTLALAASETEFIAKLWGQTLAAGQLGQTVPLALRITFRNDQGQDVTLYGDTVVARAPAGVTHEYHRPGALGSTKTAFQVRFALHNLRYAGANKS